MLFNIHENQIIVPCEHKQVNYWAKKWGIRAQQLNDAILETGSVKRAVLKNYLEKKGIIFSVSGSIRSLKKRFKDLIEKFKEIEE